MRAVATAPVGLGRLRTTALGRLVTTAIDRLRTIALATALACTASGAHADFASVVIDGVFVSSSAGSGIFVFSPTDIMSQAWDLQALINDVLAQQNADSLPSWAPANATAQGPGTLAAVSSFENTDPSTQLVTPGFTLAATADPLSTGLYTALGNMLSSGGFCFWDSLATPDFDGTSASCSGSGSLTFTVFYDLIVSSPNGLPNSAYAEINVLGTGVPGELFFDFASTVLGDGPKEDQFFTWTADVTAGNFASFALGAAVVAQAVPEPGVLSLVALGLVGLFLTRRRHGPRAAV